MATVPVDLDYDVMENDYGREVECVVATCSICGNVAEAYGQHEGSIAYAMVELSQTCPRKETNDYHDASSKLVTHMVETGHRSLHPEFKRPQPAYYAKWQERSNRLRARTDNLTPAQMFERIADCYDHGDHEQAWRRFELFVATYCDIGPSP